MPISDCLLCSISFRPLPSLPLAKRLETFISSWHNIVRHMPACSSVNVTSPLILEAPFGKGGPCQAAIIRHPTVSTDRAHEAGAQKLALAAVICHAPFRRCCSSAGPSGESAAFTQQASCVQLARRRRCSLKGTQEMTEEIPAMTHLAAHRFAGRLSLSPQTLASMEPVNNPVQLEALTAGLLDRWRKQWEA
jgi:hypothetical protein